jgi:hypothetical protein
MKIHLTSVLCISAIAVASIVTPAAAACNLAQTGTSVECPDFTAPATTAVPGPAIDGTIVANPPTADYLIQWSRAA